MLPRRERLPGKPGTKRVMRRHILGEEAILDPLESVWTQSLRESHRELDIEGHPAIEHQFDIGADGSRVRATIAVPSQRSQPISRAIGQASFVARKPCSMCQSVSLPVA